MWKWNTDEDRAAPLDELEASVQRAPTDVSALRNLAGVYSSVAEAPELGVALLEHALRLAPRSAATHRELGIALAEAGLARDAVAHMEEAARLDPDALAVAFARRYEPWRGYGMHQLLAALCRGEDWRQARHAVFRNGSFGNGSAMRVGPLGAYLHDAPVGEVVAQAALSAEITHSHPEGGAGAVAVAVAAWLAARSRGSAPHDPRDLFQTIAAHLLSDLEVTAGVQRAASLPATTRLRDAVAALGNGARISCQDTMPLALWLALHNLRDYERGVRKAIAAGGDTDTTAAIVGSVIAAQAGASSVPASWLAAVERLPEGKA
jgi:ADP-ribosylglycohydrolase